MNAGSPNVKKPVSKHPLMIHKDPQTSETSEGKSSLEETVNRTDPNITLISVFSSDAPPNVHVRRSVSASSNSSKSSQLFSLFRIPKNIDGNSPPPDIPPSQIASENVIERSSNASKTLTEVSKRSKHDKNNRIISFVRYLFCHLVPARADATVTPMIEQTPTEEIQPSPPPRPPTPVLPPVKVYRRISFENHSAIFFF